MASVNSISFSNYGEKERFVSIKKQILSVKNSGKKNYIGISGGPDSVLLGLLVCSLLKNVTVLYYDHGVRDVTYDISIIDKYFGKEGVNIIIEKSSNPGNTETEFRKQRYKFFEKHVGEGHLFLGHHLSDRIETTIINTKRGCGLIGFLSICKKRKMNRYTIMRPLLDISKNQILGICKDLGVIYSEDESNNNSSLTARNHIRNITIPHYINENNISIQTFNSARKLLYKNLNKQINKRKKTIGLHYFSDEFFVGGTYCGFSIKTKIDIQILVRELGFSGLNPYQINELYNLFTKDNNGHTYCKGRNFIKSFGNCYALFGENKFWENEKSPISKKLLLDLDLGIEKNRKRYEFGDKIGSKKIKKKFVEHKIPVFMRKRIPLEVFNGKIVLPKIFITNNGNFW